MCTESVSSLLVKYCKESVSSNKTILFFLSLDKYLEDWDYKYCCKGYFSYKKNQLAIRILESNIWIP